MGKNLLSAFTATLTCFAAGLAAATTAKPEAPPQLCVAGKSGQNCIKTTATTAGDQIKWHPGHYVASNGLHKLGSKASAFQNELDAAGNDPNAKGWRGIYAWAALEPQKGVYDFSVMDAELQILKTKYPKAKRLGALISAAAYGQTTPSTAILPQYLLSDSAYGPGTNGNLHGYWATSWTYNAAVWRPAVMDRFIALIKALGAHYNNEPMFEVVMLPETASAVMGTAPDFTGAGLLTQEKRLLTAAIAAFPNTNVSIQNNYMATLEDTVDLVKFSQLARAAQNGPDVFGSSAVTKYGASKGYTWGQQCLMGLAGCPTTLRTSMPIIHDIQEPEMDGTQFGGLGSPFSPKDLFDNAHGNLKASHIFWTWLGGSGPGNWSSVSTMIAANPVTNTACPGVYAGGCNTN